jgi:hypothetical protein
MLFVPYIIRAQSPCVLKGFFVPLYYSYHSIVVNGKVYSPAHLSGSAMLIISEGSTVVETYEGAPPRFEKGEFTLTNSFLQALNEPLYLVVNGLLTFSKDLNMEMFNEKISKLEVNGKIMLYEDQEPSLYKKTSSLTSCVIGVIPNGFEQVKKTLRLNGRSIRRFQSKKIYTKKPVILEEGVSRELLGMLSKKYTLRLLLFVMKT